MALKWSNANSDQSPATIKLVKKAEAQTKGMILAVNRSNSNFEKATSSSTTLTVRAVAYGNAVAGDEEVLAVLLNSSQIWEADLTNNSSAAHIGDFMVIGANEGLVNNTGTNDTTTAGVFEFIKPVGDAADKKGLVRFIGPQNITA